jgi:hypothetical protein
MTPPPTWTSRCARELRYQLDVLSTEQQVVAIDDGIGSMASAAIAAFPPGPRREFEIASWATRIRKKGGSRIACVITAETDEDEIEAFVELSQALAPYGWGW